MRGNYYGGRRELLAELYGIIRATFWPPSTYRVALFVLLFQCTLITRRIERVLMFSYDPFITRCSITCRERPFVFLASEPGFTAERLICLDKQHKAIPVKGLVNEFAYNRLLGQCEGL